MVCEIPALMSFTGQVRALAYRAGACVDQTRDKT